MSESSLSVRKIYYQCPKTNMIKSRALELSEGEIITGDAIRGTEGELKTGMTRNPEVSRPSNMKVENYRAEGARDALRNGDGHEEKIPKFTMIFNRYNSKVNMRSPGKGHDDGKSKDKNGSKYTMIFNKDVTVSSKIDSSESWSNTDMKKGEDSGKSEGNARRNIVGQSSLSSMKLNDAETLMNLYGRSNLFIPELRIRTLTSEHNENAKNRRNEKQGDGGVSEKRRTNDSCLRLYNSLTSLSKNKGNRRAENMLKKKIASLTSLDTHSSGDVLRKHVPLMQERKLFRVRSLDLSESVSSSESDLERSFAFQKHAREDNQTGKESRGERSDKKSRGDATRNGDNISRKQVQWKSEVDVIYFESHLAADGDRSGEILGRVMEPLREEWEQQRTGFYAKILPLPLGTHSFNERWQSLLTI